MTLHNCQFVRHQGDAPCDLPARLRHWLRDEWMCPLHYDLLDRWFNDAEPGGGMTPEEIEEFTDTEL
jgi:hypothetical protein